MPITEPALPYWANTHKNSKTTSVLLGHHRVDKAEPVTESPPSMKGDCASAPPAVSGGKESSVEPGEGRGGAQEWGIQAGPPRG